MFYHKNALLDLLEEAEVITFLDDATHQKVENLYENDKKGNLNTVEKSELLNIKVKYDFVIYTGYLSAKDEITDWNVMGFL